MSRRWFVRGLIVCLGIVLGLGGYPTNAHARSPGVQGSTVEMPRIPASFIPNVGQVHSDVLFHIPGGKESVFFTSDEVVVSFSPSAVFRIKFDGGDDKVQVHGIEALEGKVNFLLGNDPSKWWTGVPTYRGISYQSLYPGIDLRFDRTGQSLKGTYHLEAGADPDLIRLNYRGVSKLAIEPGTGDLLISINGRTIREHAPVAWQTIDGKRRAVAVAFALLDETRVGFELGSYARNIPLTIDPTLAYGTYLGGENQDEAFSIAVENNNEGIVYLTGGSNSPDFPTTRDAFQSELPSGSAVVVAKIDTIRNMLLYSTFIGGSFSEFANDIEVDGTGKVYVTGTTRSVDFPTVNPLQSTLQGFGSAFILKLDENGRELVFSTFWGGAVRGTQSASNVGEGIAVDPAGNIYVVGTTTAEDFPTANPIQAVFGGRADGFAMKLTPNGGSVVYSTYLGGSVLDRALGVVANGAGNAFIVGTTNSSDFPTANAFQPTLGSPLTNDVFVANINPAGTAFVYSTFLGGDNIDNGEAIALDANDQPVVTGFAVSNNFPLKNPLQSVKNGFSDVFITKFNSGGGGLVFSTFLGGGSGDQGNDVVLDAAGNVYVSGQTFSNDFPTVDPLQSGRAGDIDAFVSRISADGGALTFSTYHGGSFNDRSTGVGVDETGNIYITGSTDSLDLPTTHRTLQRQLAPPVSVEEDDDMFLAKFSF